MSNTVLSRDQFPQGATVDVPVEDLHSAYFVEHDVMGSEVEKGYRRRLKENRDEDIRPGDMEYHPTDEPRKMAALTRSVRKEGVKEPLTLAFPDEGPQTPMITNGNHRYLAAKRAGLKTVPVKRAER